MIQSYCLQVGVGSGGRTRAPALFERAGGRLEHALARCEGGGRRGWTSKGRPVEPSGVGSGGRRAGDSNPQGLAPGGFQFLAKILLFAAFLSKSLSRRAVGRPQFCFPLPSSTTLCSETSPQTFPMNESPDCRGALGAEIPSHRVSSRPPSSAVNRANAFLAASTCGSAPAPQ